MTQVHRYENITFPTPEAFADELISMRNELGGLHNEGHISGAFIYGSATTDVNAGSDIDLLVSTPAITPELADRLRHMSVAVHDRSGVPVDVSCFTDDQLSSGSHGYYRNNLTLWLKYQAALFPDNVIGRNPVEIITPLASDILHDIDTDFSDQIHYFEMTYMKGHCPHPEALLEAILNFPHKAGRETISTLLMQGYIPSDVISDAKKKSIARAVAQTLGKDDPRLVELYADLVADFDRYTQLIGEIRTLNLTKDEYEHIITETITDDLPKAIELSKRMQAAYRNHIPDREWPPSRSIL